MKPFRLIIPLTAVFALSCVCRAAPTHKVYHCTLSLPYISQIIDVDGHKALVKNRVTNKQVINMALGHALNAEVPTNQILVALLPIDYTQPLETRVAVFDKRAGTVLATVTTTTGAEVGYGEPDGNSAVGFGSGTIEALNGADFGVAQAPATLSFSGIEAAGVQTAKIVSLVARINTMQNGTPVPAVILKGTFRVYGKPIQKL
jgi:hypothetical protein